MDGDLPQGISKPARRALGSVGVECIDDCARFGKKELSALHGMGPKAVRIIGEALHERGMNFANEDLPTG